MLEDLRLKIKYVIYTDEQQQEADNFMDVYKQLKTRKLIDYPNPFFQTGGIYEYSIYEVSFTPSIGAAVIFELNMWCKADIALFIKTNRHTGLRPIIKHKDGYILQRHFEAEVSDWPLSRFILDLKSKI